VAARLSLLSCILLISTIKTEDLDLNGNGEKYRGRKRGISTGILFARWKRGVEKDLILYQRAAGSERMRRLKRER